MIQRTFHLLKGHRNRSRLLRQLGKPNSTLDDALRIVKAFTVQSEALSINLTYNTKMFKRMKLTGDLPLSGFKSKRGIIAVFAPKEIMDKTDADLKLTDISEIESSNFTQLVVHPSLFKDVVKLGKYLGPKNLMPSVKKGTVTEDLQKAIDTLRSSTKVHDNDGIVNVVIGNSSQSLDEVKSNLSALFQYINTLSNTTLEQNFVKSIHLTSTFSPAVPLKRNEIKSFI